MPTTQPRISTVVERPLMDVIEQLAKRDGMSVSQKTRDILVEALETIEDVTLDSLAQARKKTSRKSYSLAEVKRRLGIR